VIFALGHAGTVDHAALLQLPPASLARGTSWAFRAAACAAAIGAAVAVWMLWRERGLAPQHK